VEVIVAVPRVFECQGLNHSTDFSQLDIPDFQQNLSNDSEFRPFSSLRKFYFTHDRK
jgi:hypothetical protein